MLFSNLCDITMVARLTLSIPLVLAVLAIGLFGVPELVGNIYAQTVIIETSSGDHMNRFFGEGVLQVTVTDPDADNDNVVEEITIEISADPDSGGSTSADITVPETNEGSGKFEFFLVHVDAIAIGPDDLDPINTAGVEGDGICIADCAPLVTFGQGGDLDVDAQLYDDVRFEILVDNTEAIINYEETPSALELDRESYGTTSYVYISILDQDANLNPTQRDEFTVDPDSEPNDDLLELHGGTFEGAILFRETGDNSAIFEGRYRLGESILVDSESLLITLFDKANYSGTLAAAENDSNNIDEIVFTVGDSDGTIEVGDVFQPVPTWDPAIEADKESYSLGETVHVTIVDQDANVNSGVLDSIQLQVSTRGNQIEISAIEKGANTGIFEASFRLLEEIDGEADAIRPGGSVVITYTDKRPADYSDKVQAGQNPETDFTLEIDIQLPVKSGIDATDVTAPIIEDVAGGSGPYIVGTSLTLSTTITNNNDQSQDFVLLIEVRDSDGVTLFLGLQSGTLDPSGSADIGVSWQPGNEGSFEVRTFAITDLGSEADVLSRVVTTEINVIV